MICSVVRQVSSKVLDTCFDSMYNATVKRHVMEKIVRLGMLYDLYGDLLTEHQKAIFGALVNEDLSLSEIAADQGITRQGVQDMLKRTEKKLEDYESKLHLLEIKLSEK